jgi:hypothetical protein
MEGSEGKPKEGTAMKKTIVSCLLVCCLLTIGAGPCVTLTAQQQASLRSFAIALVEGAVSAHFQNEATEDQRREFVQANDLVREATRIGGIAAWAAHQQGKTPEQAEAIGAQAARAWARVRHQDLDQALATVSQGAPPEVELEDVLLAVIREQLSEIADQANEAPVAAAAGME